MESTAPEDRDPLEPLLVSKVADGVERYMWVYTEEDSVVLSVPGVRDLKFSIGDAEIIGELMAKNAEDAAKWKMSHVGEKEN